MMVDTATRNMKNRIRVFVLFVGVSLTLCWPAFLNETPLIGVDTTYYLEQGRVGVTSVVERLMAAMRTPINQATSSGGDLSNARDQIRMDAAEANFLRTVAYSAFAYVAASGPFGLLGIALAQAAIVTGLVGMLAGRRVLDDPLVPVAAAFCVCLTAAPFYVSTAMPDILAAVVILSAMIIASRLDHLGTGGKIFLFGAASFAVMSHYGHLPLALATGTAALLVLLVQSRITLTATFLAFGPLGLALVANLGVSSVLFEEPSVAPLRLPLLLARSMEDGPAYWHLENHCMEYRYAVCELWGDDMPTDLGTILWAEDSLIKGATREQMTRIRQEEMLILKRAFLEYPVAQSWSLAGNAISQIWSVGLRGVSWGGIGRDESGTFIRDTDSAWSKTGIGTLGYVNKVVILLAIGLILVFAMRDGLGRGDREREILFVAVIGLLANALIYGGLSAPVDRYQARVIWIIPMLAAFFWLSRRHHETMLERADV